MRVRSFKTIVKGVKVPSNHQTNKTEKKYFSSALYPSMLPPGTFEIKEITDAEAKRFVQNDNLIFIIKPKCPHHTAFLTQLSLVSNKAVVDLTGFYSGNARHDNTVFESGDQCLLLHTDYSSKGLTVLRFTLLTYR